MKYFCEDLPKNIIQYPVIYFSEDEIHLRTKPKLYVPREITQNTLNVSIEGRIGIPAMILMLFIDIFVQSTPTETNE